MLDAVKLCVEHGNDVNAANHQGWTALHGAALWGWTAFTQFLADSGANLQAADRNGMKPLDIALGKVGGTGRVGLSAPEPHPETAALLQKLTAKN